MTYVVQVPSCFKAPRVPFWFKNSIKVYFLSFLNICHWQNISISLCHVLRAGTKALVSCGFVPFMPFLLFLLILLDKGKYSDIQNRLELPEAVFRRCSIEKVILEISLNYQKNTSATASFFKQSCRPKELHFLCDHWKHSWIYLLVHIEYFLKTSFKCF